jgi:hypothetical protein
VCGGGRGTLQDRGGTNKINITPLRVGYLKENFVFVVVVLDMDDCKAVQTIFRANI